jgi:hypothetical protein
MTKQPKGNGSTDEKLKGNVMVGKKATLRQFENVTVSLMTEFFLDQSDHVKESRKLMDAIDSIIQVAKKSWIEG